MQLGRFKHMCDDMEGIAEIIKAPYVAAEQVTDDLATSQTKLANVEAAAATFEKALQDKLAEEQDLLEKVSLFYVPLHFTRILLTVLTRSP